MTALWVVGAALMVGSAMALMRYDDPYDFIPVRLASFAMVAGAMLLAIWMALHAVSWVAA